MSVKTETDDNLDDLFADPSSQEGSSLAQVARGPATAEEVAAGDRVLAEVKAKAPKRR